MEQSITLDLMQFLFSASRALDAVEEEILGAAGNHSRRVAYLSARLGERLGLNPEERADLAAYALLHDNALTEYQLMERRAGRRVPRSEEGEAYSYHCEAGEKNIRVFPFLQWRPNVIRCHHENYDGTGLYRVRGESIPLWARILRIADHTDVLFHLSEWTPEKKPAVLRHLQENSGVLYDPALVGPFGKALDGMTPWELSNEGIGPNLSAVTAPRRVSMPYRDLIRISALFAHIIDCKSPFTLDHSQGVAEKAKRLGEHFELKERTRSELYIAAYLHDIGKLAVPNALLEKPGRLTLAEFGTVKLHARRTHDILRVVDGFGDIERWASGHHERLDGSGYFRGTSGRDQDFCTRLLQCADVYQALVEERPYRAGMAPDQAFAVLRKEEERGRLDGAVVREMARVFLKEGRVILA